MNRIHQPIAVFDSGVGGISVLRELVKQMPHEQFLYFGDSANAPYGSRATEEIRALTMENFAQLHQRGIKAAVIACNTATSAAINQLRAAYPDEIIIGIEPAVKLAVERFPHGAIAVMATEATLREQKFCALSRRYLDSCRIVPIPCPQLVEFVEQSELDSPALIRYLTQQLQPALPLDAIVLGCTHFPFAKAAIAKVVGNEVALLDGGEGTARETLRRIRAAGLARTEGAGSVQFENSLPQMLPQMQRLLDL